MHGPGFECATGDHSNSSNRVAAKSNLPRFHGNFFLIARAPFSFARLMRALERVFAVLLIGALRASASDTCECGRLTVLDEAISVLEAKFFIACRIKLNPSDRRADSRKDRGHATNYND
jgi:hypothetical protein